MLIVYKMLLTLYDMVLRVLVIVLTYILSMLIVYKMLLTLYDMVYCGVHVDCVQDVTNIVRHGLLRCPCCVYKMLQTLYDMVYCSVHVDCV